MTGIILGSGTSNGVPMLGYRYPAGYLDNPKNHRTRASMLFETGQGNLLVDCPPELRLQLTRESIYDVDGVIITHTHADHVMGMDDLRSICILTRRPIPIWTFQNYHADIQRIFPYAFGTGDPGVELPRFDLFVAPDVLEFGGSQFSLFRVWHGKVPVLGIRVGDFAYITDVSEIPPEARSLLRGLETLVLDGVRRKPHPNHFHLDRAIEVAQEIGASQTYLTHLSHDYDHDIDGASLPKGVAFAYDGLRVAIQPS
jgi:phosphoribosyl 1,2-cyclic phosphate phosphodiesterase